MNRADTKIRRMTEADLPVLASYVAEDAGTGYAEQFLTEAMLAFAPYPRRPFFVVAERSGQVVGCACWTSTWMVSSGVFSISWVHVAKVHQRDGVGRAMVEHILKELRSVATVAMLATQSPTYYERWGFRRLTEYRSNQDETYQLMALKMASPEQEI